MAGVGTPRRLSYGAVAAGIGGVVLIISLFLSWFSEGGFSQTGWETFDITDILLLLLGALAIGYALLELTGAVVNLPVDRTRALTIIGIITTTLTAEFLIEGSHQAIGLILAVLASVAILVGGILAERSPHLALTLGAPRSDQGAWGHPPAGGGYGQPQQPPVGGGYGQAPAPGAGATSIGAPQPAAPPPVAPTPPPEPASPPPPPGGVADWYPDPTGQKRLRYWDGSQWTEHVAD